MVWNAFCLSVTMMRNFLILFLLCGALGLRAQKNHPPSVALDTLSKVEELPRVRHNAFDAGEKLTYRVRYGFFEAGEATIEVRPTNRTFNGRDVHHIVGIGKTINAFHWFYKVHDVYESYIDVEGVFPWQFERDVNEGGYTFQQEYRFHQDKKAVETHKDQTFSMPYGVQDMISAFYYARTFDFSHARNGQIFTVKSFVDEEMFDLRVQYLGRETIKTKLGKFRCLKFAPYVQEGRVFKKDESVVIWVSDDANKIPILAKADILIGSIKMELTEHEGVSNPLAQYH